MRIPLLTSRRTVGSNQKPFEKRVDRPPPVRILAPYHARLDQLGRFFKRLRLEHRPNLHARLEAVAHVQLLGQLDSGLGKALGDLFVQIEPRRRDAHLAVVAELSQNGRLRHLLDVGVGKNDQGCMTTQLEAQAA